MTGVPRNTEKEWPSTEMGLQVLTTFFFNAFIMLGEIIYAYYKKNPIKQKIQRKAPRILKIT